MSGVSQRYLERNRCSVIAKRKPKPGRRPSISCSGHAQTIESPMLGSSIRPECPQFFPRHAPPLSPTSAIELHCLHPCADETWVRPSDGHRQCMQVARNDRPRAFSNLALIVAALLKFLILWENGEKVIAFERDQEAAYVLPCRTAAH